MFRLSIDSIEQRSCSPINRTYLFFLVTLSARQDYYPQHTILSTYNKNRKVQWPLPPPQKNQWLLPQKFWGGCSDHWAFATTAFLVASNLYSVVSWEKKVLFHQTTTMHRKLHYHWSIKSDQFIEVTRSPRHVTVSLTCTCTYIYLNVAFPSNPISFLVSRIHLDLRMTFDCDAVILRRHF